MLRALLVAMALLAGQIAPASHAQDAAAPALRPASPVLTLDQDRLFRESAWGKAALAGAEKAAADLTAENRRIDEQLQTEEQVLTDRRALMAPADFTKLASEFDSRVEGIRTAQEAKNRAIVSQLEAEQKAFFSAIRPVLEDLLVETGASAILASGAVLVTTTATDITSTAIARIDAIYPDMPAQSPAAPEGDAIPGTQAPALP